LKDITNIAEQSGHPDKPKPLAEPAAHQLIVPVGHSNFRLSEEEAEKPICLVIDDSADIVGYLQMLLDPAFRDPNYF